MLLQVVEVHVCEAEIGSVPVGLQLNGLGVGSNRVIVLTELVVGISELVEGNDVVWFKTSRFLQQRNRFLVFRKFVKGPPEVVLDRESFGSRVRDFR